jgi:radical SAM superfamily enzyme
MGIEFLDDASFEAYNKKSNYNDIVKAVENFQKHGLRVRGLFILGTDAHAKGVGDRLADFVLEHDIRGVLIQAMYFIPGTPAFDKTRDRLLPNRDWSKYAGYAVHTPARMSPQELQLEIIRASKKIYSAKNSVKALITRDWRGKLLYLGEMLWQRDVRRRLQRDLRNL